MKVLVLIGKERHHARLINGIAKCGIRGAVHHGDYTSNDLYYDIVLIDHSSDNTYSVHKDSKIVLFDCEDDPLHFTPGKAYYEFKDKAVAYAKMNYVDIPREDNLKNIAFPITPFFDNIQKAKSEIDYNACIYVPFFIGAPTFIGNYKAKLNVTEQEGVKYLAEYSPGLYLYNQRYQWLLSLRASSIPYVGGIYFSGNDNLSIEWQSKVHGNVSILKTDACHNYIEMLHRFPIGLCPTGHDRFSWRHFDIMAAGAVLIRTDHKNQKCLYNPIEYISIKDDEDLSKVLNSIQSSLPELHKAASKNKQLMETLTPDKIRLDFLAQVYD